MAEETYRVFPVGTPGVAWGEAERQQWRSLQVKKRDYFVDVLSRLLRFDHVDLVQYGTLDYRKFGSSLFPLYAAKSKNWDPTKKMVLVTGGVHGYETSGVHGALLFTEQHLQKYADKVNFLVLPCISPWGYETINRWSPEAVDPNRSFNPAAPGCPEAAAAMPFIAEHIQKSAGILQHTDLHETTDTDNSEFTPAKTARDGAPTPAWECIPDGFYLVAASERPGLGWQAAVIQAVSKVTHIAPPDSKGEIIGEKIVSDGIIVLPGKHLFLCGCHTDAVYATTTEVYPDSKTASPEECNIAQVTVVTAGLDYALAHPEDN